MAGIWVRAGTVTLTNGSKKVTGSGTAWNTGINKVTKGCAFIYNNIEYEVDYINSDTELYLVDTYGGTTGSGLSYRIQIAVTDTIPELASRIATALAYWNGQAANLQALTTGSGNVTLTAPDGTQVTVPSYGGLQPKDALLTALAALTTAADKLVYFTGADTVDQTSLTSFARSLLDDIDAATARGTLGAQASDATLTALAGVVTAADKLIYATGVDTFSTATLTAFARTVLAGTDATAILTTLGASKASISETNSRLATDRVVTPASLNAVVPYTPTVNASLDLDFAKQKYKWYAGAVGLTESSTPSLMTFTRSSIATFFDAMGVMKQAAVDAPRIDYDPVTGECKGLLIEEARTNLLTYSNRFDNSAWVKSNCSVVPNAIKSVDGTLGMSKLVESATSGAHSIKYTLSSALGIGSFSICVKAGERSKVCLSIRSDVRYDSVFFNLVTGLKYSSQESNGKISYSVVYLGDGVYRITVTPTYSSASSVVSVGICSTEVTGYTYQGSVYTGDGISGLYISHAQFESGSFQTTHIPSADTWTARASKATYLDSNGILQTAASGVARSNAYDYDSDGVLRPIGLLLEGAATNLLLYSEQLDNAAWVESGVSITANATAAPDGNTTADKIIEDTSTAQHYAYQSTAVTASTTYTYSVHAKAAERTNLMLATYDATTTYVAIFNLATGTVVSVDAGASAAIKKSSNGFYRCSITTTTGASATSMRGTTYIYNNAVSYTGDGASGIYVWGAQLGAGSYATSYIATTSAQVTRAADASTSAQATRAADNAVISGANFSQWYKQYEGTLVGEVNNPTTVINDYKGYGRCMAVISDGSSANQIIFGGYAFTEGAVISGSAIQSDQIVGSVTTGPRKLALACKTNNVDFASAGVLATTDTSATIKYLSQINLGRSADGSGVANAHIRSLKYYPKALSSTELQAMTA